MITGNFALTALAISLAQAPHALAGEGRIPQLECENYMFRTAQVGSSPEGNFMIKDSWPRGDAQKLVQVIERDFGFPEGSLLALDGISLELNARDLEWSTSSNTEFSARGATKRATLGTRSVVSSRSGASGQLDLEVPVDVRGVEIRSKLVGSEGRLDRVQVAVHADVVVLGQPMTFAWEPYFNLAKGDSSPLSFCRVW